jgi:hypothetical protein
MSVCSRARGHLLEMVDDARIQVERDAFLRLHYLAADALAPATLRRRFPPG